MSSNRNSQKRNRNEYESNNSQNNESATKKKRMNVDTLIDLINGGAPIIYLVGRMNPPTPGHLFLLRNLIDRGKELGAVPIAFITTSYNEKKFTKFQKTHPLNYINNVNNSKTKPKNRDLTRAYVKHKNYENPLSPEDKKLFLKKMAINKGILTDEQADEVIVIDNSCSGLFKAVTCAINKFLQVNGISIDFNDFDTESRNTIYNLIKSKLYFLMGNEEDPKEQEGRRRFCDPINCIFIEREKPKGETGDKSMSGSKIRLLAACEDRCHEYDQKIVDFYSGFLNELDAITLARKIRRGVNLKNEYLDGGQMKRSKQLKKHRKTRRIGKMKKTRKARKTRKMKKTTNIRKTIKIRKAINIRKSIKMKKTR